MCGAGEGPGGQGWGSSLLKELPSLLTFLKVRELSILSLGVQRIDIAVTLKYPMYLLLLHPTHKKLGGSSSKVALPICSLGITSKITTKQNNTNSDHRVKVLSAYYVPGTVLSILCISSHLIFIITQFILCIY